MLKYSCLACGEARGCYKHITAMVVVGNFRGAWLDSHGSKMQLVYLPFSALLKRSPLALPRTKEL